MPPALRQRERLAAAASAAEDAALLAGSSVGSGASGAAGLGARAASEQSLPAHARHRPRGSSVAVDFEDKDAPQQGRVEGQGETELSRKDKEAIALLVVLCEYKAEAWCEGVQRQALQGCRRLGWPGAIELRKERALGDDE
jgi:hypothetical protein